MGVLWYLLLNVAFSQSQSGTRGLGRSSLDQGGEWWVMFLEELWDVYTRQVLVVVGQDARANKSVITFCCVAGL